MTHSRRTILQRTGLAGTAIVGGATGTVGASDDARVDGTITDFGSPVAGATVTFDGEGAGSEGELTTESDEDGSFSRTLSPGTYTMTVAADGYAEETRSVAVESGDAVTVTVQLDRSWGPGEGELELDVTRRGGGRTIPSYVTVYGDEVYGEYAPRGSIPDPDQHGRGFVVSEGWWEIRVSNVDGYSDGYAAVYVPADETVRPWVQLSAGEETIARMGTIAGRILGGSSVPIADATVTVDGEPIPIAADGTFETDVAHGRHEVEASAPGYEPRRRTVEARFGRTTTLPVRFATDSNES
ncbi:carboxypeptidase regulatory-like domain-containing protein [Halosolutus amylolyticus]|uniref:Carboxypeptidase regulatory-like domain-containing protein n=1 Tax=Halosolutus amylolyticus TaxID=2932267 RepID=A0ABD5PLW1_9EURY|nr:carboxypeptidase regulatory-like domain-containing protein [Halosolutus amylolyticus]